MTDLRLVGNEPAPQPQQPQFPQTNVQIQASGLVISTILAPGLAITTALDEQTMNQICTDWIRSRRDIKRQLDLAAEVMRTKNRQ